MYTLEYASLKNLHVVQINLIHFKVRET